MSVSAKKADADNTNCKAIANFFVSPPLICGWCKPIWLAEDDDEQAVHRILDEIQDALDNMA